MRPFCIATIGGILGIIIGLYFKSIALLVIFFILLAFPALLFFVKIYDETKKRIKVIVIFEISLILFSCYTMSQEKQFAQINQKYDQKEIEIQAIIISGGTEQEYKKVYQIQVIKVNEKAVKQSFNILFHVKKQKKESISLEYGDLISFKGLYETPSVARNEGGFDYSNYLKTRKITGITTIKEEEIKVIDKNKANIIKATLYHIRENIVQRAKQILPEDTANLCTSLLVGEKAQLSDEIQETFRQSNLSHMLAISGAHVSYILFGIATFIQKVKVHKRLGKVFLIFFFLFYMGLTGFTTSVVRSCIMVILQLLASLLFRKSDTYQNLAISSFIILFANPYTLLDISFQLSFGGTIGIILFAKILQGKGEIDNQEQHQTLRGAKKKLKKIKEMCMVTLAANLAILPIMMYHFNTISLSFFISNLLASPILGASLIVALIFLTLLCIYPLAKLVSFFLQPILQLLIWVAKISSKLPFSQILVPTPKIWQVCCYYLLLVAIFFDKSKIKNKPYSIFKKTIIILLIFFILFPYFLNIIPNSKLTISFVDVGQGDCMLIQTPSHKNILIDGGGIETSSFDVGEKVLIPYLLDRGIMSIDYMIFSHFDSDHCQGLLRVMEKLKVRNVIISKQGKNSNNYLQFLHIAKQKRIKIIVVQAKDTMKLDKQCKLSILFPKKQLITTNVLNNNSLVAKFEYQLTKAKKISLLLTGDIEKMAEQQLIEMYQNTNALQADILKVAHHRLKNFINRAIFNTGKTKNCIHWSR